MTVLNQRLEHVEHPSTSGTASEVDWARAENSTRRPGDGAFEFKKIAFASDQFAKDGVVPNLVISMDMRPSAGVVIPGTDNSQNLPSEERQNQIEQLRKDVRNLVINAGITSDKLDG